MFTASMVAVCLNLTSPFTQEQRLKELSKRPSFSTTDTSPISTTGGTISTAPAIDLFSTPSCSNGYYSDLQYIPHFIAFQSNIGQGRYFGFVFLCCAPKKGYLYRGKNTSCIFFIFSAVKMESDLFDLQSTFQPSMQPGSTGLPVATAWAGKEPPAPPTPPTNICVLWTLVTCSACSPSLVVV